MDEYGLKIKSQNPEQETSYFEFRLLVFLIKRLIALFRDYGSKFYLPKTPGSRSAMASAVSRSISRSRFAHGFQKLIPDYPSLKHIPKVFDAILPLYY